MKMQKDYTTLSGTTPLSYGRVPNGLPRRFLRGPGDKGRTFSACPLFSPISQNRKSRGSDIWTGSAKWQEKKQGRGKEKRGDRAVLRDPRERKEKTKKPSVRQNHPHRSVPR